MKIILLQDVRDVGKKFEERFVADGYATNFLLPRNMALVADKSGLAKAQQMKDQGEAKRALEEKELSEKEAKRQEKHQALEEFRLSQREPS